MADPVTWAMVIKWAAQAFGSYIASEYMKGMFAGAPGPNFQEVLAKAVQELEAYFRDELKRQLDEHELMHLKATALSAEQNLRMYADLPPAKYKQHEDLLEAAQQQALSGLNLAGQFDKFGIVTAPLYANLVTFRGIAVQGLARLKHTPELSRSLGKEISSHAEHLQKALASYNDSLDPEIRLSALECGVLDEGKPTQRFMCCFKIDGHPGTTAANCGVELNGTMDQARATAISKRSALIPTYTEYRRVAQENVIAPLQGVTLQWISASKKLKHM